MPIYRIKGQSGKSYTIDRDEFEKNINDIISGNPDAEIEVENEDSYGSVALKDYKDAQAEGWKATEAVAGEDGKAGADDGSAGGGYGKAGAAAREVADEYDASVRQSREEWEREQHEMAVKGAEMRRKTAEERALNPVSPKQPTAEERAAHNKKIINDAYDNEDAPDYYEINPEDEDVKTIETTTKNYTDSLVGGLYEEADAEKLRMAKEHEDYSAWGAEDGISAMQNAVAANKADDPEHIKELAMRKLKEDEWTIKNNAAKAALELQAKTDEYIDRAAYAERVWQRTVADTLAKVNRVATRRAASADAAAGVLGGMGESIAANIAEGAINTPGKMEARQRAAAEWRKNAGVAESAGRSIVSFVADMPFFGLSGELSGAAVRQLAKRQIAKYTARGLSERASSRLIATKLANSFGERVSDDVMKGIVGGAVNLGAYEGGAEAARRYAVKEYSIDEIMKSVAHGAAMGSVLGISGGAWGAATAKMEGVPKLLSNFAGYGIEAGTFTATGVLEKMATVHKDEINWLRDFGENLALVGAMKASKPKALLAMFSMKARDDGNVPKFTETEVDEIRNTTSGRRLYNLLTDGKSTREEYEQAYERFVNDPGISFTNKQKVSYALTESMVRKTPAVVTYDIETGADGKTTLTTRAADGMAVERMAFDSKEAAAAYGDRLTAAIIQGETSKNSLDAGLAAAEETRRERGLTDEQMQRIMTGEDKSEEADATRHAFIDRFNLLTVERQMNDSGLIGVHEDGMVHKATMYPRAESENVHPEVYVVKGNLVTREDGSVDKDASSKMIYYADKEGDVHVASPEKFERADAPVDSRDSSDSNNSSDSSNSIDRGDSNNSNNSIDRGDRADGEVNGGGVAAFEPGQHVVIYIDGNETDGMVRNVDGSGRVVVDYVGEEGKARVNMDAQELARMNGMTSVQEKAAPANSSDIGPEPEGKENGTAALESGLSANDNGLAEESGEKLATSADNQGERLEITQGTDVEPKPIGKGVFGNIYDQFKGKVKEAFDFLMKHKSGDLFGVFHRDEIGDIDLVWGDETGGLCHIIKKHIKEHDDFKSIDEAISIIDDVIKNGDIVVDGKLRYKLKNGKSYTVTIRKDFNGDKKNWVVTAVDESRSEEEKRTTTNPTSTPQGVNEEGKSASSSSSSAGKDTQSSLNGNELGGKIASVKTTERVPELTESVSETAEQQGESGSGQSEATNVSNGLLGVDERGTSGNSDELHINLEKEEINRLLPLFIEKAEVAKNVELSPEAWEEEFGETGIVETPVGNVKMGENQYLKILKKKRNGYFGMIKPTLINPDIILEEYDPKDGAERDTKYLFVKTFIKADGSRIVHFESVTVQKGNLEVFISSHEIEGGALIKKVHQDNLIHLNDKFFNSERRLIEPQSEGSDLVPTPNSMSSVGKDTQSSLNGNELGGKIASVKTTERVPELTETVSEEDKTVPELTESVQPGQTQVSAFERIPKNEKGEPIYEQAETPDIAWDAIVEQAEGDEAMAQTVADGMVADKEAALKKAEEAKSKGGATISEKIAAEKERKAAIEETKAQLETWKRIAHTAQRRTAAEQAERSRIASEKAAELKAEQDKLRAEKETDEEIVGRNLTSDETVSFIAWMEDRANVAPEMELTPENWLEQFGDKGKVETPIGEVKMGENQYFKIAQQGRQGKLGMVKPTLEHPSVIIEDERPSSSGKQERESAYVFVRTFVKEDGSRYYHFTSVTVSKDGHEVVISNQEKSANRISKLLQHGKVTWINKGFSLHPKTQIEESVPLHDSNKPTSTDSQPALLGVGSSEQKVLSVPAVGESTNTNTSEVNSGFSNGVTTPAGNSSVGKDTQSFLNGNGVGGKIASVKTTERVPNLTENVSETAERQGERQGDLDEAEINYQLSDEVDENGRQFVLTSNNELSFGEIQSDTGLTPAPILLSEGIITNPATNDGYGLVHIEARHGEQIRKAGYKSVIDFIEKVAHDYEIIKEGNDRVGNKTYLLQLKDKHNNTLIVELSRDENYWNINTAGVFKTSYGKNRKEVYNRHTTAKQSAETVETSQGNEQSDTQLPSSMDNVSTTSSSASKDTQRNLNGNGLGGKIAKAEAETNTTPTDAQKEAGNYKKGHVQVGTFDITIENPKGSVRSGIDANGKKWESPMLNTYGYFRGTEGTDGDHIDVFLADGIDEWNGRKAFVMDQYNEDGTFDEHKVMLGFNDIDEAEGSYYANYSPDWREKHPANKITAVNVEEFEKWMESSHRKTKAFAEYASVKTGTEEKGNSSNSNYRGNSSNSRDRGDSSEGKLEARQAARVALGNDGVDLKKGGDAPLSVGEGKEKKQLSESERTVFELEKQLLGDKGIEVAAATEDMVREVLEQKSLSDDIVRQYSNTLSPRPADAAKINKTIDNLKELSKNVENQTSAHGAITDFANAIGAKGRGASKYAEITLPNGNAVSIRISNHNANANTYDKRGSYNDNISIVFKSANKKNGFVSNENVELTEYVYTKEAIAKDGKILSSVAESLSDMIKTGTYVDKSGKAIVNHSPSAAQAVMSLGDSHESFADRKKKAEENKGTVMPGLAEKEVKVVEVPKHEYKGTAVEAKNQAIADAEKKYIDPTGNEPVVQHYDNYGKQFDYTISKANIDESMNRNALKNSANMGAHIAVLNHLPEVIGNSIEAEEHADYTKTDGKRTADSPINESKLIHRFYGAVNIDGATYRVKTTMVENSDEKFGNNHYTYEVTNVEVLQDESESTSIGVPNFTSSREDTLALAKLLKGVEKSYDKGKKLLDESEKNEKEQFQIGYHGSPNSFESFDHSHMGEGEGAQAHGWGTYVAKDKETGVKYARQKKGRILYKGETIKEIQDKYIKGIDPYSVVLAVVDRMEIGDSFNEAKETLRNDWLSELEYSKSEKDEYVKGWQENLDQLDSLAETDFSLSHKNLYTVDIPDNNGSNYLDESKPLTKEQQERVISQAEKENWGDVNFYGDRMSVREYLEKHGDSVTADQVYNALGRLNLPEEVSKFLGRAGFTGIRYGGRQDGECYVIFNEGDAKITEHVQFFKSRDGKTLYGWTKDGKIYLTQAGMNPDTPLHEFTHIFDGVLQKSNPELWNRGKELLKATSVWDDVMNDPSYADIRGDEDKVAGEVHSRLVGKDGAELLVRLAEEAKGKEGIADRVKAMTVLGKLKEWLKDVYRWIVSKNPFNAKEWSKEDLDKMTVDDFNAMTLGELAKGRKMAEENGDGVDRGDRGNSSNRGDRGKRSDVADNLSKGNEDVKAETDTIIEKAKADGTYMKAPNGEPTRLNEKQWAEVRTKAFKTWFGDWEKVARIEKLKKSAPVKITGKEIEPSDDLKQYKKNALEYGKSLRGEYTNKDTGIKISLTGGNKRGGIREILQHDYKDIEHLQSIAAIPQIIENAVFIDELPNDDVEKYEGVKSFSYYVCGLKIGTVDYTVKAVIANQNNGERYYDHKLSNIEKGKLLSILPTIQKAGIEGNSPLSAYKDKRLLSILQTNSSKVVDESGEPMVVSHSTNKNFTIFKDKQVNDAGWLGEGYYFFGDRSLDGQYGKNVIEVFLDIKEPYYTTNDEHERLAELNDNKESSDFSQSLQEDGYDGVYFNGDLNMEYVAFAPSQIKSATENTGAFSREDDDIRYQLIGEEGAKNADKAEEATTRIDNLNVARKMETAFNTKKERIEKLRESKPVEIVHNGEFELNRKAAKDWLKENIRGEYINADTGEKIGVSKVGIDEVTAHGSRDESHLKSLVGIPRMIESSIFIDEIPNTKGHDKYDSYRYYVCGLKIDGIDYTAKIVVGVKGDSKYYDHRLSEIEKGTLIDNLNGLSNSVAINQRPSVFDFKDTKLISILQTNDKENAKKIKLATGWERGADGKWRYEVEDFNIDIHGRADKERQLARQPWAKELSLLGDKIFDGEELTAEEEKRFDELSDKDWEFRKDRQGYERKFLPDYVKEETLLNAYPKLKSIEVEIVNNPNDNTAGVYKEDQNKIVINDAKPVGMREILIHEIQHAIQHMEGFARGGNESIRDNAITEINRLRADVESALDKLGYKKWLDDYLTNASKEELEVIDSDKRPLKFARLFAEKYKGDNKATIKDFVERGTIHTEKLENEVGGKEALYESKSGRDYYRRLSGEVESRNASNRMYMTAEERRRTLASETEDVARRDQIFINDALRNNVSMSALSGEADEVSRKFNEELSTKTEANGDGVDRGNRGNSSDSSNRGNLTPLSERFNEKKDDIRFSLGDSRESFKERQRRAEENKGTVMPGLAEKEVKIVKGEQEHGFANFKEAKDWAKENIEKTFDNEETGGKGEIKISGSAVGKFLSKSAVDKSEDKDVHLSVLKVLPAVIKSSIEAEEHPDYKKGEDRVRRVENGINDAVLVHRLYGAVEIGDNVYRAKVTMNEFRDVNESNGPHSYEATKIELLAGTLVDGSERSTDPSTNNSILGAKLLKGVEKSYDKGKKLLDESKKITKTLKLGPAAKELEAVNEKFNDQLSYVDKKKALDYLHLSAPIAVTSNNQELSSAANIVRNFENPSVGGKKIAKALKLGPAEKELDTYWRDMYDKATLSEGFKFREASQNGMASVRLLQEVVAKESGSPIKESEDVCALQNRLSSTDKIWKEYYGENYYKPIIKAVGELVKQGAHYDDKLVVGPDNDILTYLIAKHGMERNIYFRDKEAKSSRKLCKEAIKETEALRDKGEITAEDAKKKIAGLHEAEQRAGAMTERRDYSGLTELFGSEDDFDAKAQAYVEGFESRYDTDGLWKAINAATKESLRKRYEGGLLTREGYEKAKGMFKYYIPLQGWSNDVAEDLYHYKGGNSICRVVKRMEGRTTLAENPIAVIGTNGQDAILQAHKNMVKQRLYNMAMGHDTSLLTPRKQWYQNIGTKDAPDWQRVYPDLRDGMDADDVALAMKEFDERMASLKKEDMATQKRVGLVLGLHTTKGQEQQHRVNVCVGGREYNIFVNGNPRSAQALNGELRIEEDDNSWIRTANNWVKKMKTSYNLQFVPVNYVRDSGFATFFLASTAPVKYLFEWGKQMAVYNPLTGGVHLNNLINKTIKGQTDMSDDEERYMHEFLFYGGETGFTIMQSVNDYKKLIKKEVKNINSSLTTVQAAKIAFGFVERTNRVVEDATRFATYVASRKYGRSIDRSIMDAKEVSLNFNTVGADGMKGDGYMYKFFRNLRLWYFFPNPAIQALNKLGVAFKTNPVRTTGVMVGTVALLGYAMAALCSAVLGDDDDEEVKNAYMNLPKWVRRTNIVIPAGGTRFVTIPLSYELRVSYGMGEMFWEIEQGLIEPEEMAMETLIQLSDLLPVSLLSGTPAQSVTPDLFVPVVDLLQNKDFFGKPIWRDNSGNELKPEYTKAYAGTASWLTKSTEVLNNALPKIGGAPPDKYTPGLIDWNPAGIEHWLNSYLGGPFSFANKTAKSVQGWVMGDEDKKDIRNIPFLSSFLRDSRSGNPITKGQGDRFNSYMREYKLTKQRYNGYRQETKHGVIDFVRKLKSFGDTPEGKRMFMIDAYKKSLDKIDGQVRAMGEYQGYGDDEKRMRLKEVSDSLKKELVEKLDSVSLASEK